MLVIEQMAKNMTGRLHIVAPIAVDPAVPHHHIVSAASLVCPDRMGSRNQHEHNHRYSHHDYFLQHDHHLSPRQTQQTIALSLGCRSVTFF